jgi:predicted short-subunit dehydrogenase-like oxidoreductase (DUF2520 family)
MTPSSGNKPTIGFVGAGVVGGALARRLAEAGYPVVAVASRSFGSAVALAAAVPGCAALGCLDDVAAKAEVVFITTPDDAIASVAASTAWRAGQAVVHCSGALSVDVLAPAARAGVRVGSFHPLQTFASLDRALVSLTGTTFVLEGDDLPLLSTLQDMAEALGGRSVLLRSEDKVLYHAAAVLSSNYVVTLLQQAAELWEAFGRTKEEALTALLPLLRGTAANLESLGLPGALTGPVSRGDLITVAKHLEALESFPDIAAVYRTLAEATVPIALAKGRLAPDIAASLIQLLHRQPMSVAS